MHLENFRLVIARDEVERHVGVQVRNSMMEYDQNRESENAVIETLEKQISKDTVQKAANLIR